MSTRNLAQGKTRPEHKAENLTDVSKSTVRKMRDARRLTNVWSSRPSYRDNFYQMFDNGKEVNARQTLRRTLRNKEEIIVITKLLLWT
jgi:hypothetical protein